MKAAAPLSIVALLAASAAALDFNPPPVPAGLPARLNTHLKMRREVAGRSYKRCRPKGNPSPAPGNAPASPPAPAPAPAPEPAAPKEPTYKPQSTNDGGNRGGNSAIINVQSNCGDIGATAETTNTSGPNGAQAWLNCGVEKEGWTPPFVTVHDLKFKDLGDDLKSGQSIFKPCSPYLDAIYDAAAKNDLPPVMIASIMMQESSCNKDTVGGGGEQGLMQITVDKCGGAPGGDCKEPWYNINTGAKYLSDRIKNSGGNVLVGVAEYNGWHTGLTIDKATAAKNSNCCRCQNNLDYLQQFFNGWMQCIDAYSHSLGTYHNLDVCN